MNKEILDEIKVNRYTTITWFKEPNEHFRVQAMLFNREIYNRVLDKKYYNIYCNFINERIRYLVEGEILNKEYIMILLDGTMYQVIDETSHFKELLRVLIPVNGEYYYDIENHLFDLVLDCTLSTGEVFDEYDLAYHNGLFYNNGYVVGDIREFEREGICYEPYDLLNGLNDEQMNFLIKRTVDIVGFCKINRYVTSNIIVNIDR